MIFGSGLIASTFTLYESKKILSDCCIYAAGVSNSSCNDDSEFLRDRNRLQRHLDETDPDKLFVYFSTCSIDDPSLKFSRYVNHKFELEALVRNRERYLVVRLPQVAGFTPNPHTILNFLYARISRSESFDVWRFASRNIIDVDDVARIVLDFIINENANRETINVANPRSSSMPEIIEAFEKLTNRQAIYKTIDRGATCQIDITRIVASIDRSRVRFDDNYIFRTLRKYFE